MAFPTGVPQQRFNLSSRAYRLLAVALLAAVYYLSARWSLLLAFEGTNASPVWPPSGIALSALLLLGRGMWPGVAVGAFAANLATFAANHVAGPVAAYVSLSIAIGNTLEALAGYYLLRSLKIVDFPLEQPQSVFKFMMAALFMCVVSACIGTASLILGGIASAALRWPIWINWWLGDVGGVLIATPLIMTWLPGPHHRARFRLKPAVAMSAVLAGFALLVFLLFRGTFSSGHADRILLYLCMPYLAWIAYHFGQRGVSLASLLLGGISVWGTTHDLGPFATGDLNNSLILLVSFIALCCVTGLILASDIAQRSRFKNAPITAGDVKIPWITLLIALGVTMLAWHMLSVDTEKAAEGHFKALADDLASDINERLVSYEQILRGGAGLFAASQDVSRTEWHAYARHLDIGKILPGMQSFAFAEWVSGAEKQAYVERVRKDGFPGYGIRPAGDREAYLPIRYIEPFDWRNQRASGYDMLAESVRRAALLDARDSGTTTISGKITLMQEAGSDTQAGFVMYMPVYRNGAPTATVTERRAALWGYVCSGFRMGDLIQGILHQDSQIIGLEIFDGRQITPPQARMYASASLAAANRSSGQRLLTTEIPLQFGHHAWTLRMTSLPAFEASVDRQKAQIILVSGIIVSLLLFILVRSLAMTRESALVLANDMTTALRQSEAQQRLLNSRMELAAEAGGIGVWEWDIQTGRVNWDSRMYEMYQIDPAMADNTFDMWRSRLHPNDVEPVEWTVSEALVYGRPYATEFSILLPGGQLRRIKANALVIRNETGEPQQMIGINLDITELRQTEEALRASEEHFRGIFEHSPIGMAIVAMDGRWLDVNSAICEIVGYSKEELGQLTFQDITYPDDLERSLARVRELVDGEVNSYQIEKRYVHKDGRTIWALLTVALVHDERNEPLYFLAQIMNVTDRKQKEQAIAAALAEKEVLLKEVYHRVKNNLQVITSLFNLQLRTLPEGVARTALQESAERVRAMALVHEKLYQSSDLSSIRLDSYLQDLCRQISSAAAVAQRAIRLVVEIEPIEIGLELAVPLGLLLNELVSNSLKHGFPDGRSGEIRVKLARAEETPHLVTLEVADNGIGMPPDLDIPTCSSLGLKLANTLSAQMDAVFRIESDRGTRAILTFSVEAAMNGKRTNL